LLGLILGLGATEIAAGRIVDSHATLTARQLPFQASREQFERISDRIQLIPAAELVALKLAFRKMRDDLCYVGSETLPGAEDVESELRACLAGLDELTGGLETEARAKNAGRVSGIGAELELRLQQIKLLLRRREERIRLLR
jgi:hypothetical protein